MGSGTGMLHNPGRTCSTGGSGLVEGAGVVIRRAWQTAVVIRSAQEWVAREAEEAFTDLAADDLGRAARDRQAPREDLSGLDARVGTLRECAGRPDQPQSERGDPLRVLRAQQ